MKLLSLAGPSGGSHSPIRLPEVKGKTGDILVYRSQDASKSFRALRENLWGRKISTLPSVDSVIKTEGTEEQKSDVQKEWRGIKRDPMLFEKQSSKVVLRSYFLSKLNK